jgi:surface antigen
MKGYAALLIALGIAPPCWAANICNETVPSNRIIDGIPAYNQCTDSTSSPIYSNNGVDTATGSGGADWVRTQGSGGYQCTELAHRYLHFKWNVKSVPNGNAGVWCDGNIPSGLVKTTTPVHGDVIVFAPGSCGADQTTGHVAVVDVVNANGTVTFIEQNRAGRRSCATNTAACFLHVISNSGTVIDGGAVDGSVPGSDAAVAPDARPDQPADNRRADLAGSGGVAGTGGAPGTGGAIGTGGMPGSGGTTAVASAGSGGTTAITSAGNGGTTGAITTAPPPSTDSGCSCRLAHGRSADAGTVVVVALLAGLVHVRRRRRKNR